MRCTEHPQHHGVVKKNCVHTYCMVNRYFCPGYILYYSRQYMGKYSPHEEEQEATQDEIRSVAMTAAVLITLILTVVGLLATVIWGITRLF